MTLLVWLQLDPLKTLYWYLLEFKALQDQGHGIVEFVKAHRDHFLEAIDHEFTDEQFRSLVKAL